MEQSVATNRVDVGPKDNRPAWTLALGLLSLPGSTLAWDLPAGGFWIGLPLAVAAIVIGVRSRRESGPSTLASVGMFLAAAMIVLTVVWTLSSIVS